MRHCVAGGLCCLLGRAVRARARGRPALARASMTRIPRAMRVAMHRYRFTNAQYAPLDSCEMDE